MTATTARVHGPSFLWARAPRAVAAAGLAAAMGTGAVIAASIGADSVGEPLAAIVLAGGCALCAALGSLIVASVPRHGLGVALLAGGLIAALWSLAVPLAEDLPDLPEGVVRWAAWTENWAFTGLMMLVTWPLLLFPDGRLPSRRWRPFAVLLAAGIAAIALRGMLDPGVLDGADTAVPVTNPLGVPSSWRWIDALGVIGIGFPLGVVASVVAVMRRTAGARQAPIRTTRWAAGLVAANFVLWFVLADTWLYAVTFTATIGVYALTATYALLRHRVVEVDQLLRRAFIAAGVSVLLLAVFAVVFALVTVVAGDGPGAVLGSLAAVAVALPLYARVRRRVDTALWGHRDAGLALSRVQAQLDGAQDPATTLAGLADAVADALGAGWVRIAPDESLAMSPAVAGAPAGAPAYTRELFHRGVTLGRLELGARAPGEPLRPADVELADLLAGQLTLALDALGLATQLRHSRGGIITAREEERRRLRRDLHDELGPALAGVALTLEAAQHSDPAGSVELIREAQQQAQAIVSDVRRIVHGLRPPVLDELGLAAALRAYAERLRPLEVVVDVAEPAPEQSAAAEIAVYRIATEALTNVVRHASARRAEVRLRIQDEWLELRVQDDGIGFPEQIAPGVGLRSMTERAAELEGTLTVGTAEAGGVLIVVRLPRGT
jgi:signal transduction histidine kinase